jgi:hypothetical protein
MADVNEVLTAFREELVLAGLVRKPGTAGVLPPLHVEPQDGAPAPGDREAPEDDATRNADGKIIAGLVVTVGLSGDLGEAPGDSYRRRTVLDVRYRYVGTTGLKRARDLDEAIANRIVRRADYGIGYLLADGVAPVFVLQALIYSGLGVIGPGDELAKYLIETSR